MTVNYYEYCPSCNHNEVKKESNSPTTVRIGTNGWGQPVKFTNCECGKLKGFLVLDYYAYDEAEITERLSAYLKTRIKLYSEIANL